jgi:hypothetical protein
MCCRSELVARAIGRFRETSGRQAATVGGLAAGAFTALTSFIIVPAAQGTVTVDPDGRIPESDVGNDTVAS